MVCNKARLQSCLTNHTSGVLTPEAELFANPHVANYSTDARIFTIFQVPHPDDPSRDYVVIRQVDPSASL